MFLLRIVFVLFLAVVQCGNASAVRFLTVFDENGRGYRPRRCFGCFRVYRPLYQRLSNPSVPHFPFTQPEDVQAIPADVFQE
ncbi:hypothetical protein AB6A40_007936 [Gnathostoma spinigerum]|uniref:Secreted protein n=1 Tax=Gnathostoma spinigerum TaxID=75299 RepID=A0ABD6EX23_9BILA